MSQLGLALGRIASDLDALGASWALVGGLAVGARAEPRTTRDIDIAVLVADDAEAERLTFALRERGYGVLSTVEQRKLQRLATVRLRPPSAKAQGPVVDLLFCSSSAADHHRGARRRQRPSAGRRIRPAPRHPKKVSRSRARAGSRPPLD